MNKEKSIETIKELMTLDLVEIDRNLKLKSIMRNKVHLASLIVNINTRDYDEVFVNTLTDIELEKLIRILVVSEKYNFLGSVTAVPNLLKILKDRNYFGSENLFNWIIQANGDRNPYIPMGNFKGKDVKTFIEYTLKT